MDVSISMKEFLKKKRDRAVGSILGWAESELKPGMSKEQWEETRRVVLGAVNSYHDTMLDLIGSDGAMRNDYLVELLERVDGYLARQNRRVPEPLEVRTPRY